MITQEYALTHKDEYAVIDQNLIKDTLITANVLENPENFQSLINQGLLSLENCLTIGQVLDYSKLVINCNELTPLTTDKINTYKQKRISYEDNIDYKTIEYITLPSSQTIEGGTYEIADKTWRKSPAHDIKQGDIIRWHKMQNLTLTADDIGTKIVPLDDYGYISTRYLLPSYFSAIIEGYYDEQNDSFYENSDYSNLIQGQKGKIYIDLNSNKTYRFSSNSYILISDSNLITNDELTEILSNYLVQEDIINLIENKLADFTIRTINSGTITVSANDNYTFNQTISIPSVEGYIPISVSGYSFSDGEANLNKMNINNGNIEIAGTILLNGSNTFNIDFNILYVITEGLIPQADENNY